MEYRISDSLANLKPSAIREIFKSLTDPTIISFSGGNPSPLSFPVEKMAAISADIFATSASSALQYGITEGYTPLRDAVKARIKTRFGIDREGDSTIIVTGGTQGLELTCRTLCNPGDTVVAENPSFIGALNSFRATGCNVKGVTLREDGMDLSELEAILKTDDRVRMIYTIPTFQNPAGTTSTEANRRGVYALAKKYGVMILEDNPYGELRFAGKDVPTIKSMDTDGIVFYCSSFSKILSSGMRVGFLVGPEEVMQKVVVAKQCEDVHTNLFFQMLTYRFMTECDLDAHIRSIQDLYRGKCELMLRSLDEYMPKEITYTRPEGGLFLWMTLPEKIDMTAFVKEALARKVAVVPGTAFNCDTAAPSPSVRLNYSMPSDENIVRGCKILGELAAEMLCR